MSRRAVRRRRPRFVLLRAVIAVVRRRKLAVAVCLLIGAAFTAIQTLRQPDAYSAVAQVAINRGNIAATAATGSQDPNVFASDFTRIVKTQADVARSLEIARTVVQRVPEAQVTPNGFRHLSRAIGRPDSDVIVFAATFDKPEMAKKLAAAFAQAFVEYRRQLDMAELAGGRRQLLARIRQLRVEDPLGNADLINTLTKKEEQLATLQALQTSNASVVSAPTKAVQVSPRYKRNITLGLVLGLGLAAAAAFALEGLETRVREVGEIEDRLDLPLLGQLPPPPEELRGAPLMLAAPRRPEAEAFRMLRTNLMFSLVDPGVRALMVTSAVPDEGKSTTVANLAITMARAGSRVALVDLDLRRPAIGRLLDLGPGAGITQVALGEASLEDALVRVPLPAGLTGEDGGGDGVLDVLKAGVVPPDPGEFVGSAAVDALLRELRERYDVVLVDAPPALQVGDPMILAAHVDAVLVIVRRGVIRRALLDRLRAALDRSSARVVGFAATGAAPALGYGTGYAEAEPRERELVLPG